MPWPEPSAKLWLSEMQPRTHGAAELGPGAEPTLNTASPCHHQIMCNISRTLRLASVCYSKGLVKCVWVSTRGVLSFEWKASLVFLISQWKTGRWDVCRPINYQKRHCFQEPFFMKFTDSIYRFNRRAQTVMPLSHLRTWKRVRYLWWPSREEACSDTLVRRCPLKHQCMA